MEEERRRRQLTHCGLSDIHDWKNWLVELLAIGLGCFWNLELSSNRTPSFFFSPFFFLSSSSYPSLLSPLPLFKPFNSQWRLVTHPIPFHYDILRFFFPFSSAFSLSPSTQLDSHVHSKFQSCLAPPISHQLTLTSQILLHPPLLISFTLTALPEMKWSLMDTKCKFPTLIPLIHPHPFPPPFLSNPFPSSHLQHSSRWHCLRSRCSNDGSSRRRSRYRW